MSFLIVTEDLRISAVSEAAERIFGSETELLGTMLFTAIIEPAGSRGARCGDRARGRRRPRRAALPIELERGGRPGFRDLEARIASCGPPRGALVAIEPLLA